MKKFDPTSPLWQYQLREYLLLYDSNSEEERIQAYHYGCIYIPVTDSTLTIFKLYPTQEMVYLSVPDLPHPFCLF
ncbi:MAG: hypothetical protein WD431_21540 [Cyclobacteriaceae bacterium]